MLPSRLNFLSEEKKNHLYRMVYYQFIKTALEIVLVVVSICGITLLGGLFIMQEYFISLAEKMTIVSNQQASKNTQIKKINRVLSFVNTIQNQYILWTPTVSEISNAVPEGIILNSLNLDAKNKNYSFSGLAKDRNALLLFKKNLESIPNLQPTEIPLSQLTNPTDISFSFTVKVK